MENTENKSIISTGSSNLAKTEKLLSITQKILSEIKPKYESVRIGNQEWMTRNLYADRFRNGDLIPHIESYEEWEKVGENGHPALCYYDNDPENGKKYGKLYNWYAVNDPRGLAPEGWRVPTDEDWTSLVDFLGYEFVAGHKMKSIDGWEWVDDKGQIQDGNGDNLSGFKVLPGGCRNGDGSFLDIRDYAFFWSSTEDDNFYAWYRFLLSNSVVVGMNYANKSAGASIRCLRDD